ncbi:MAG: hypothetical protein VX112_05375 [Pseudomonadota bacterium]|nr:hypothetical protein [Pseudomonadota bacterium]
MDQKSKEVTGKKSPNSSVVFDKTSNQILNQVEIGIQTAHQATVYHQFFFANRFLIENITPLFISHIIHLHPVTALFTIASIALTLVIVIQKIALKKSRTYSENLEMLLWLKKHDNKRFTLDKRTSRDLQNCINEETDPIQNIQSNFVLGLIHFTLTYLSLIQVTNFVITHFVSNLYTFQNIIYIFCAYLAIVLEQTKNAQNNKQSTHKTLLCRLLLSNQSNARKNRISTIKEYSKAAQKKPKQTTQTNLYLKVVIGIIAINIFYLSPEITPHILIPLVIVISSTLYMVASKIITDETLRTNTRTYITTFTAAQALLQLTKDKFVSIIPVLIKNSAPTLMSKFMQSAIVLYTFILYLYHLTTGREYRNSLMIQKAVEKTITRENEIRFSEAVKTMKKQEKNEGTIQYYKTRKISR